MVEPFPKHLLSETLWDFDGQPVLPSRAAFNAAVIRHHVDAQEYAPDIQPEECWRPHCIALRYPRVVIRYYCDPADQEESWREAELSSDDGESFTAGELLFKLHNAIVEQVRGNGHHWFEGLELQEVSMVGTPVYCLVPGS